MLMAVGILSATAQDVIVKSDGSTILCKVIGVNNNEVIYAKWSDLNGPQYIMDRSLISNINYQDGRQEKLNDQTSNLYAPGLQQTGETNFNDNALLRMDFARNTQDYLKRAKTLKIVGWTIGSALFIPGITFIALTFNDDGTMVGIGAGLAAVGIATTTVCLIKAKQYQKKAQMIATAPIYQHEFSFKDGSSICAGIDMIRNNHFKQTSLGLGLQYNF